MTELEDMTELERKGNCFAGERGNICRLLAAQKVVENKLEGFSVDLDCLSGKQNVPGQRFCAVVFFKRKEEKFPESTLFQRK